MLECISHYIYISTKSHCCRSRACSIESYTESFPQICHYSMYLAYTGEALAKCKEARLNDEAKDDFMKSWNNIIEQPTEELFNARLRDLEDKYNDTAAGSEVIK